jgi:hypothetical protein
MGVLSARLPDVGLERVADPRERRGRRWRIDALLATVLVGLVSGARSLQESEELSEHLSPVVRRRLGIPRRVSDTTQRDLLTAIDPGELRSCIHRQVRAAHRRKQLAPNGLPCGVVSIDGKCTATTSWDDEFAQRQTTVVAGETIAVRGVVRTLTCSLVSSPAKACIDAVPIPPKTNECGHFPVAFNELMREYGGLDLFEVVMADAGLCSRENADLVDAAQRGYLFRIRDGRRELLADIERVLGDRPRESAIATTVDHVAGKVWTRRLWLSTDLAGSHDWPHLRTVLRVEADTVDADGKTTHENRYYVSNVPKGRFTSKQWLAVIRAHWGVENNCHHTWDTAFAEDDRPWIREPRGMVAVQLLRRLAYNLVALFRIVTQRSEEKRGTPWRTLLRAFYRALTAATDADVAALRSRRTAAAGA